jgi:hypothetical protein
MRNMDVTLVYAELDALKDYEQVKRIWCQLYSQECNSFFLSWDWFDTWIKILPRFINIRLVVGSQNNIAVMAFFKCSSTKKILGIPVVKYSNINCTGVAKFDDITIEYNNFVGPYGAKLTMQELLHSRLFSDVDVLVMPGFDVVPRDINSLKALGYRAQLKVMPSYYVDLDKVRQSDGGYIALLSKNKKNQIRRSNRLLSKGGIIKVAAAKSMDEAEEMFSCMVGMHQASWLSRDEPGVFSNSFLKEFHEKLLKRCLNHSVEIFKISAGEVVIGYIYGFVSNNKFLYYQSGFVVADSNRLKPGLTCHVALIDYLSVRGLEVYDFLAGGSDYKQSLATASNQLTWAYVYKKNIVTDALKVLRKIKIIRDGLSA